MKRNFFLVSASTSVGLLVTYLLKLKLKSGLGLLTGTLLSGSVFGILKSKGLRWKSTFGALATLITTVVYKGNTKPSIKY